MFVYFYLPLVVVGRRLFSPPIYPAHFPAAAAAGVSLSLQLFFLYFVNFLFALLFSPAHYAVLRCPGHILRYPFCCAAQRANEK